MTDNEGGAQMDIDKMTLGELKEISALLGNKTQSDDSHWKVGKNYFIRTVTHHFTGRLVKVTDKELVIEDAAWIADDGRFAEAIAEGQWNEVEPFPSGPVIIGRGSLVDAVLIKSELPRIQK